MWENLPLWPVKASSQAAQVDALFIFLLLITVFFSVLIFTMILVFAVRFRKAAHPVAEQIEGSTPLELTWTLIPLGISLCIFAWGAVIYFNEQRPPADAMDIYVVGKQWMWKIQHLEGQREINELHVPVNRDIRLIMTSQDVIHSFYIPAFRLKQDVVPGRYGTLWFRAIKPGNYHLFCAEYCGTMHSGMIGQVVVMEAAQYEAWQSGGGAEGSLSATGQKLFQELGCSTCHRFDTQGRGPNLVGVFGKPVLLDDGRTVTADENYIRESILNPGAKIVGGFKNIMPTFQNIVSEEQLISLVAYIKSLHTPQQSEPVSNRPPVPNTSNVSPANPPQNPKVKQ